MTLLFPLLYTPEIQEQRLKEPEMEKRETVKSIISGSALGSLVSFLPGITSAHANVMATLARRNRQPEEVITTLSGVNSSSRSKYGFLKTFDSQMEDFKIVFIYGVDLKP